MSTVTQDPEPVAGAGWEGSCTKDRKRPSVKEGLGMGKGNAPGKGKAKPQ